MTGQRSTQFTVMEHNILVADHNQYLIRIKLYISEALTMFCNK